VCLIYAAVGEHIPTKNNTNWSSFYNLTFMGLDSGPMRQNTNRKKWARTPAEACRKKAAVALFSASQRRNKTPAFPPVL
jgi:hypothetical protein